MPTNRWNSYAGRREFRRRLTWTAIAARQFAAHVPCLAGQGVGVNLADAHLHACTLGTADYRPAGGVRDVHADTRLTWQLSRKLTLTASLQVSRLQGDAAASPRTQRRTGIGNWVALGYRF